MRTITFYSYKGGVGRSLALSNIAIRLSELGKKVCVMDFDLEAPGLQFKFGTYERSVDITKGLMDYIYQFSCEDNLPDSISDFAIDLKPENKNYEAIKFIPAGNFLDNIYWKKLSMIQWSDMFYSEEGSGVDFFLDLKAKIENEFKPDFLLIDSRTGITDISGITLKLLADEVVILAANNEENILGCEMIMKNLMDPNQSLLGVSPRLYFMLTRLPFKDNPEDNDKKFSLIDRISTRLRATLKADFFEVMVLHSEEALELNERPMISYQYEKGISIGNDYLKLFDALTSGSLDSNEVQRFHNIRLAEDEFKKGQQEKDPANKIRYFSNAVKLDERESRYLIFRASAYAKLRLWENAIEDYKAAQKIMSQGNELAVDLGYCFFKKRDYEKALNYLNETDSLDAVAVKIDVYTAMGEIDKALSYCDYALNFRPNSHQILNRKANIHLDKGVLAKAYLEIFDALKLDSLNPLYSLTLSAVYAKDKKYDEFFFSFESSLRLGATMEDIINHWKIFAILVEDKRFRTLLAKYNLDIEILKTNN